jgi:hypothetical protein
MKGRSRWSGLAVLVFLMLTPALGVGQPVVVPNGLATTEGNSNNAWPFNCDPGGSQRYQQVYLGSEVGTRLIGGIGFRQDPEFGDAFGPTTIPNVTITLSTTAAAVDGLSSTFADNVGPDVTTVFSGNLTLSSATCSSTPCPFDILIPLTTGFPFNASAGDLLLDVTIPNCTETAQFDAADDPADSVSRVVADPLISVTANYVDTRGLVTQFNPSVVDAVRAPAPALSLRGMVAATLILVSLGVLAIRRRSRI